MSRRSLAMVLLGLLAWGCQRGGVRITSVRVVPSDHEGPLAAAGLDRDAVGELARAELEKAGFRLVDGPPGYRARVEVLASLQDGIDPGAQAEVSLALRLSPDGRRDASPVAEVGTGRAPVAEGRAAWRAALLEAAREASSGLALAVAAEEKPIEKLLGDLRAADARRREQAIRALGDRRSVEAVPGLIAALDDPEPLLAERAAGALSRIGDPRAVGPIIDFSMRLEGGRHLARYARIVGDIGGAEARGYLLTLESGHADPFVRQAARDALADLDARDAERGRVAEKAQGEPSRPGSGSMAR